MTFDPARAKVSIGSLDDPGLSVVAQFNPKELELSKKFNWAQHNKANANGLQQEFSGAGPRSLKLELLFDGFEKNASIAGKVATLEKMAAVRNPTSAKDEERRPHHCVVVWGTVIGGSDNKFKCVITNITTTYLMFSSDGAPLRAKVTLDLSEADRVSMAPAEGGGGGGGGAG